MKTDKNHELLCALVLGELPPGDDRDQVEAALAQSPELRAEKERIEDTIGLVAQAFDGDAKLSGEAAERLLAAAQAGPVGTSNPEVGMSMTKPAAGLRLLGENDAPSEGWRGRDSMRAAAGFVLFLGVAFVSYQASSGPEPNSFGLNDELAQAPTYRYALDEQLATVDPDEEGGYEGSLSSETRALQFELSRVQGDLTSPAESEQALRDALEKLKQAQLDQPVDSPAATPAQDPAAPVAKVSPRRSKKRSKSKSKSPAPPASAATPPPTESFYEEPVLVVGGVVEDSRKAPNPRLGRVQVIDEVQTEVSLEEMEEQLVELERKRINMPNVTVTELGQLEAVTLYFRLKTQGGFSVDSPFDAKNFYDAIGIGRGAGGRDGEVSSTLWSYLAEQPLDFDQKLAWVKHLALEPFTAQPGESPRTLYTRFYAENPFVETNEDALSTFGIDVDDASWLRTRASLRGGQLPDPRSVRVEEFVNAFRPDVPAPTSGETFALAFEVIPQRFGQDARLTTLRVALRGREVAPFERKPLQLTFVVDVSGSMDEPNRLPLVKETLGLLVDQMGSGDSLSIVSFADEAKIVQPMVSAANRTQVLAAIDTLASDGGTNAEAGLVAGYEVAAAHVAQGVTNRVVLLSDGIPNLGETDQARLTDRVAVERERGVYLNTVGVGLEPGGDAFLEQLADRGDGLATWMQDAEGARRSLVENFTGAFETIARDVKIQVEFAPGWTSRWRQVGYENRAIADRDFRNDKVDAGEVGAGHQIVALYELESNQVLMSNSLPLHGDALATVRVRWKSPEGDEVQEIEQQVDGSAFTGWDGASAGMQRSVLAARFAEVLRRSKHAKLIDLEDLAQAAERLSAQQPDPDLTELSELIRLAQPRIAALPEPDAELEPLFEALRDNALRKARYQIDHPEVVQQVEGAPSKLPSDDDPAWIDLGRERQDLEQRVTEVLRKRLEAAGER